MDRPLVPALCSWMAARPMAPIVRGAPPGGGLWDCPSFFHLGTILPLSLLAAPAAPGWPDFFRLYISAFRFLVTPVVSSCPSSVSYCPPPWWIGGWHTAPLFPLGFFFMSSGWWQRRDPAMWPAPDFQTPRIYPLRCFLFRCGIPLVCRFSNVPAGRPAH